MDWSRAKTILICAFLLLDLFLLNQVNASRTQQWTNVEINQGSSGDLHHWLQQLEITLEPELPQQTPDMQYINVEHLDRLMPQTDEDSQLVHLGKSTLVAQFQQPLALNDRKDAAKVLDQVSERIAYATQYVEDKYYSHKEQMWFWQQHNDVPIFVAPLVLFVNDAGVTGYKQTYVHIRTQGSGRQVISASTALRSLVEKQVIVAGETIKDVTLGYYGHEYDAEIQVLAPVWRFIHDGQTHYVNAFTGAVELPPDNSKWEQ